MAAAALATASLAAPLEAAPNGLDAETRHTEAVDPDRKVVVSVDQKWLWLVENGDTVFSAPIAVGKEAGFQFADQSYYFKTPRGTRAILSKENDPDWVPPDWHYYEKAVYRGLEPVHLENGDQYQLSDGTYIEVRENQVGRVNRWGNWWPFTPGSEIIFDGMIFIPPLNSPQRRIPNALGPIKLSLGDGYLIHGTHRYNTESIGSAASHGCIRMRNEDVERLSGLVDVGTTVVIF
ncbi:MAG TPA: L,D-transpeptidase [Longimicrobiales bacterium]|nr:L,D-transpeptidase [Longimicrobiales bacterium]